MSESGSNEARAIDLAGEYVSPGMAGARTVLVLIGRFLDAEGSPTIAQIAEAAGMDAREVRSSIRALGEALVECGWIGDRDQLAVESFELARGDQVSTFVELSLETAS